MPTYNIYPPVHRKTMPKINTFLLSLLFLGGCFGRQDLPVKGNSDFEEMLIGFPDCDVENIYLDPQTKNLAHKYFLDRDLKPRLIKAKYTHLLTPVDATDEELKRLDLDEDYSYVFSDEYFAYFDIDETFHGLKVDKIVTTAAEVGIYAIFLQSPVAEVEKKLETLFYLGFDFFTGASLIFERTNCGTRPILFKDPNDHDRSILKCGLKQDIY